MWRQRTCYERDARARAKGRPVQATQVLPEKYEQATSPFQSMSAIQIPFDKSKIKEQFRDFTQETFSRSGLKKNLTKSAWSVSTTKYKSGALQMPSFREHVGLKTNILADNDSRLLTLPWFGDIENDKEEDDLVAKLQQIYELVHGVNGLKDLRNEQCRFYTGSIDKFLKDIGITWDTILYWLLAPEAELERVYKSSCSRKDVESLLVDRSAINTEAIRCSKEDTGLLLERSEDYRQKLLSRLERPSTLQLMQTALACAAILKKCSFSPWYMARQSKTMRDYVQGKTRKAEIASDFKFRRIICRVCHTHNCLFHGQVRERPDSEPDSECEDSTDKDSEANDDSEHMLVLETIIPAHVDSDDSDVEKVINYRLPMNAEVTVNNNILGHKALESKPFDQKDYLEAIKWENRKPFIPCSHAGDCAEAKCRCFREGVTCEKTCRCPSSCNRRFPGCNCASGPSKRPCAANRGCLCAKFHRECDADLCVACGATEILDPANRYNDDLLQDQCRNVGIQRGVPKKTLLGQSEVHGFGLYAGQDIKRDDIVGEYTGEILSTKESERREHIYGYEKNMYLFKLNMEQDVDATRMGNKLRFINNANPDRSNCYPKVLFCNTVFRIALFANSDIKAGTELFFHYNYPAEMTKHFKQPKGRVVAVKQPVTQPSRPKQKRVSSPSPSRVAERPYQANILERARAAKAAKRAAMLAERDLQTTLNSNSNGPLRAQKSVPILQSQRQASSNSRLQGRPGVVQDLDIEESFTSESAIQDEIAFNTAEDSTTELLGMSTPSPVIQDTDEEDELFPEGLRGDVIPSDDRAVNRAVDTTDRVASTTEEDTRTMIIKSEAPLFVAEEIRETQGEMRHEEFRKRKRPVITNSDDDE
ncbi:hypothetical protein GQ44DRAFT_760707 [Phaeosphaeriaceae sp. PMI808]|nr:hypothetical protein GQ44DRAFT_760707 [Phaeosphaeriaceae sp. PMI808]